ncbi:LysR family transcriptional regulator [Cupriavidus necator]|uniref:LysR family transcriptional regulator n=1 Tax=Cupriavidus necator TaxID=106590 RepID=A0A1U9ULP6_CUPNE|nr:LysR family transcriptional regulator [Cupriavidus necator]AQV93568.1 LysR family transcriptional regulator [Cupriavidus necator]
MDARLRQAVAVGRFGSFSKAADAVGVTQSAVTKSVADLERRLGYPIFHRTSRGVVPTDEGRVFLERALRLLTDAAELLGQGRQADPHAGTLRVGVFPGTIEWLLAWPLEQLLARHPSIRLDITTGAKEHGLRMLEHGDVDVAIGMEIAFAGKPQFHCDRIATIHPSTFVRRGHPALSMQIQVPADLAPYPIILPAEVWEQSTLHHFAEIYGPERTDWFHKVENFALTCKVVESTDAIGVVDAGFAATGYFRERFCTLEAFPLPPTPICCATREQWTPKPAAAALIALLRQVHGRAGPHSDLDNRLAAHTR